MWETFENGATPFAGIALQDVTRIAAANLVPDHLTRPKDCPALTYKLMCQMWSADPAARPPISDVLEHLEALVDSTGPTPKTITPPATDYVSMASPVNDSYDGVSSISAPSSKGQGGYDDVASISSVLEG